MATRNQNQNQNQNGTGKGTSNRGFASMDQARQREIASMGGKAAHRSGNAHEFDSEEAREAGRKGGQARAASRREQSGASSSSTSGGGSRNH